MNWYLTVLKKYAEFTGRARRKEYWMFILFNTIIIFALAFSESYIGTGGLLMVVYSLAVFIPSIAVTVRRLHDYGKSGWWILVTLVPLIGSLVLLFFTVQDSQHGDNMYGPNPKEIAA